MQPAHSRLSMRLLEGPRAEQGSQPEQQPRQSLTLEGRQRLQIPQLAQVPQLHSLRGGGGHLVPIFRKGHMPDGVSMPFKRRHLLQQAQERFATQDGVRYDIGAQAQRY